MLRPVTTGRSAVIVALALAALALTGISGGANRTGGAQLHPHGSYVAAFDQPESTAACESDPHLPGIRCYSPFQIAHAYGLDRLVDAGIDGSRQTIAIVIPFGSPTIQADLTAFDHVFGVTGATGVTPYPPLSPDPQLTVHQIGTPPPDVDPDVLDLWANETTLDVEWAHVFAPRANILVVETAADQFEGPDGFPEIEAAEKYAVDHGADVIVQTFGATEQTFPSTKSIMDLRDGLTAAAKGDVTVVNASGDTGSTNFDLNGDLYPMPVVGWPSTDPLVTAVGGTELSLDDGGQRTAPDVVWNDSELLGQPFASGGGLSAVFDRPAYQDSVKGVVGNARGLPDISMSSGIDGAVWIAESFDGELSFDVAGGTSAGTPMFGGLVALADELAGKPLGQINGALYSMPYGGGLVDVTTGDNNPHFAGVPGFSAAPGYDLASGLGTVDPTRFVPALAAAACQGRGCGGRGDCAGTLTFAAFPGDLHVKKGTSCTLTSSAVDGNIKVDDGGSLVLDGVTLGGKLDVGRRASCSATGDTIVAGRVSGQCAGL
jgi:subtilase family serine protease